MCYLIPQSLTSRLTVSQRAPITTPFPFSSLQFCQILLSTPSPLPRRLHFFNQFLPLNRNFSVKGLLWAQCLGSLYFANCSDLRGLNQGACEMAQVMRHKREDLSMGLSIHMNSSGGTCNFSAESPIPGACWPASPAEFVSFRLSEGPVLCLKKASTVKLHLLHVCMDVHRHTQAWRRILLLLLQLPPISRHEQNHTISTTAVPLIHGLFSTFPITCGFILISFPGRAQEKTIL